MKFYQKLSWKLLKLTYGTVARQRYGLELVKKFIEPDAPFILLANHYYHKDPFFISYYIKKPLHFLGSDEIATLFQQVLGNLVGLVYTKKGMPDTPAIRELIKFIKKGDSIAMFPEGDGSWDGETSEISINIIKFIKRFNLPIVTAKITGGYFITPKWAVYQRKGKVSLDFKVIKTRDVKRLDIDELKERVEKNIYNNDIKNKKALKNKYKGKKLAEGIQFLLWKCPECNMHDTIYGNDNDIICKNCNTMWELDSKMQISPAFGNIKDIKDWNEWQKKEISRSLTFLDHIDLTMSDNVRLSFFKKYSKVNKRKMIFDKYADGKLFLTRTHLRFEPENNKEKKKRKKEKEVISFENRYINSYVDCVNKSFRFVYEGKIYQIEFKGKNSSRYIYYLNEWA